MGSSVTKVSVPAVILPEGYTAIITGAHAGLGYELAKYLALLGARVILACDSEIRAKAAILRMKADFMEMRNIDLTPTENSSEDNDGAEAMSTSDTQSSSGEISAEYMHLDLRTFESVERFVHEYKARNYPLHLLVCNAAVVHVAQAYTEDGNETHLQKNYLSHFLLTLHMLPLLTDEHIEDPRIINISSQAHTSGDLNLKSMQGKSNYNKSKYYANSKLYQIMSTYALERRFKESNLSVFSMHPSSAEEEIKKKLEDPAIWRTTYNIGITLSNALNRMTVGVNTCLKLALDPNLKDLSGSYFVNGIPVTTSTKARDSKAQEVLWKYSIDSLKNHVTVDLVEDLQMTLEDLEAEEEEDKK